MMLELIFCLFWLYYFQKECRRAWYHKPVISYFTNFGNIFELTLLALSVAGIVSWLTFVVDESKREFSVNNSHYLDMYDFAVTYIYCFTLAGFMGLMFALKVNVS